MNMNTKASSASTAMTTESFLALVHGKDAPIYFQVGSKTWRNKPQTFRQAEATLRWRNAEGEGVCYLVNAGGTKDAEIARFNACFLDWDCGRGADGRYWPLEVVGERKQHFVGTLRAGPLQPSILVETRNGFHAYWLLKGDVSAAQFRDCQKRLARLYGGDIAVCNPARAMRLPGFAWIKAGYQPFPVRVVSGGDTRFSIASLLEALPDTEDYESSQSGGLPDRKGEEVGLWAHNRCKSSVTLAPIVGAYPATEPIVVPSISEALELLKRQDLAQYLGIGLSTDGKSQPFQCPFHADTNPSACIFRNDATGHYLYRCHSSHCGVSGTIIDLAMRRDGSNDQPDAIKRLLAHYRISIDTGWKIAQKAKLDANIAILADAEVLKATYPSLFRLVGRIRHDLIVKLRWFGDHITDERNRVGEDAVFFASLRHFHKLATGMQDDPKYFNRQNEKVDRYCLLGLLRKVSDADLPEDLLIEARRRQKERRHAYRVQWYSVPAYTIELLRRADERASKLIVAGVSVRGVSRELVTDLLGAEAASEMYPQRRVQVADSDEFALRLTAHLLNLIETNRYTTVAALRRMMRDESRWKSVTERQIEKSLPGILARNGLRKVTCNGPLKAALGISAPGFPKVIVPVETPLISPNLDLISTKIRRVFDGESCANATINKHGTRVPKEPQTPRKLKEKQNGPQSGTL